MSKRLIKNNIKKALFFSSSIILSTSFFATYLIIKNACHALNDQLKNQAQEEQECNNNIKSLNRKKNQAISSLDKLVSDKYGFVTPDPEGIIVFMGKENE